MYAYISYTLMHIIYLQWWFALYSCHVQCKNQNYPPLWNFRFPQYTARTYWTVYTRFNNSNQTTKVGQLNRSRIIVRFTQWRWSTRFIYYIYSCLPAVQIATIFFPQSDRCLSSAHNLQHIYEISLIKIENKEFPEI